MKKCRFKAAFAFAVIILIYICGFAGGSDDWTALLNNVSTTVNVYAKASSSDSGLVASSDGTSSENADTYTKETVSVLQMTDLSSTSVSFRWFTTKHTCDGYNVYRKDSVTGVYMSLFSVQGYNDGKSRWFSGSDSEIVKGVKFTYMVKPYHILSDGTEVEDDASPTFYVKTSLTAPSLSSATRSGTKVTLKWKKANNVKGYEIYRKSSGGSYKLVKTVSGGSQTSCVLTGNKKNTVYKYKIRGYIIYRNKAVYTSYSTVKFVDTAGNLLLKKKIKKLENKYKNGYYWNHMGKSKYNSDTMTKTPCNHDRYNFKYCNVYYCPTGWRGMQCYGFAWKMSDLIYGKKTKYTKHKSFKNAKIGDVIRYHSHSVIIIEKKSDYIIVGECNYGNTCMIKWGRKIYKDELSGAVYFHRDLS